MSQTRRNQALKCQHNEVEQSMICICTVHITGVNIGKLEDTIVPIEAEHSSIWYYYSSQHCKITFYSTNTILIKRSPTSKNSSQLKPSSTDRLQHHNPSLSSPASPILRSREALLIPRLSIPRTRFHTSSPLPLNDIRFINCFVIISC
jgi:hypothetical protein